MAKRKRRRSQRKQADKKPKGYDFGVRVTHMGVGTPEVAALLNRANVVACALGESWSPQLKAKLPSVSLVGREVEPLREAFSILKDWSVFPGDDAVTLSFVFLEDGGYLVCLAPEFRALRRRTLGFGRAASPLIFLVSWIKYFDAAEGGMAAEFRRWRGGSLVAPYLLSGAVTGVSAEAPPQPGQVEAIGAEHDILKFEVTFADEAELSSSDPLGQLVQLHRKAGENWRKPKARPRQTREDLAAHRSYMLRIHFPVTGLRSDSLGYVGRLRKETSVERLRRWQVVQALANLQLSRKIGGGLYYMKIPRGRLAKSVTAALDNWWELADGNAADVAFPDADVLAQIVHDSRASLAQQGFGVKDDSVAEVTEAMDHYGLLSGD